MDMRASKQSPLKNEIRREPQSSSGEPNQQEVEAISCMLTTGQVAEILKTSVQTVTRICDSGKLRSSKVPGSSFRRIFVNHLIDYMNDTGVQDLIPSTLERVTLTPVAVNDKRAARVQSAWSKPIMTSGDLAAILHLAPRTVAHLIDSGLLKGYELPDVNGRRVSRETAVTFMRKHGMEDLIPAPFNGIGLVVGEGTPDSIYQVTETILEDMQDKLLEARLHRVRDLIDLGIKFQLGLWRGVLFVEKGSALDRQLCVYGPKSRQLPERLSNFARVDFTPDGQIVEMKANFKTVEIPRTITAENLLGLANRIIAVQFENERSLVRRRRIEESTSER